MHTLRNVQRVIGLGLIALCWLFAGCGQGGDSGSPTSPPQTPTPPSPQPPDPPTADTTPVTIADPGLQAAVASALGKHAGDPVTRDELAALEGLDAGSAQIADLTGLEWATGLLWLDLNTNDVSDLSPLAELTGLEWLDLNSNSVSDLSPLAGLTALTSLNLNDNNVSDISPLARLTALEWLSLWNNSVSDVSPLAGLTALTSLDLFTNSVSDIAPLARLTGLEWLSLWSNRVSDVSALGQLTDLQELHLNENDIPDVSALGGLTGLELLGLGRNGISDIAPLGQLTGLEELRLNNNEVSDISVLARLTALRHLDLTSNSVTDLTPIAGLSWSAGDVLYAADNPLRRSSIDLLSRLADAGLAVDYDLAFDDEFPGSQLLQLIDDRILVMRVPEDLTETSLRNGLDVTAYAQEIYRWFDDEFDYLVFLSNLSSREDFNGSVYSGTYRHVMNDTTGTGRDIFFDSEPGSAGKLRGMLHFPHRRGLWRGPGLHEFMHPWANYAVPTTHRSHWGFSSANGQLGGFDRDDLVELGGGRYSAGRFGPIANGGNSVPYSPIELYLAGLIPPEEVPDLWVAVDGAGSGTFGGNPFTASDVREYSIEDIVAENGPRVPASAQRHFRAMVVLLLDDRPVSRLQVETLSEDVAAFSHPGDDGHRLYNYYEATGGRGTMTMDGLSRFRRSRPRRSTTVSRSFGRIPPPHICEPDERHDIRHQFSPRSPAPSSARPAPRPPGVVAGER